MTILDDISDPEMLPDGDLVEYQRALDLSIQLLQALYGAIDWECEQRGVGLQSTAE